MRNPVPPWVVTLFAPPTLRVSPQEYRQILGEAARLRACQRAWARRGWRPYDRSDRFGWGPGDLTSVDPTEDEA
jgi:hypothetical protein